MFLQVSLHVRKNTCYYHYWVTPSISGHKNKTKQTNKQTFRHGSVETSEQAMDINGKLQPVSGEQMVGRSALFYYYLRAAHTI